MDVPSPLPYALRVDFLPPAALALPGRLGLTRAPGRLSSGRALDSDLRLREDVEAIARVHGAKVLVTLLERAELDQVGDLRREARRAGITWLHFPIPDMWVPADVAATRRLVVKMLRALEGARNVVVHCWGGLGRAGTIAACCLVARGTPPDRAIALVRATREGAVQSAMQERFVREFSGLAA